MIFVGKVFVGTSFPFALTDVAESYLTRGEVYLSIGSSLIVNLLGTHDRCHIVIGSKVYHKALDANNGDSICSPSVVAMENKVERATHITFLLTVTPDGILRR